MPQYSELHDHARFLAKSYLTARLDVLITLDRLALIAVERGAAPGLYEMLRSLGRDAVELADEYVAKGRPVWEEPEGEEQ